MSSSTPSADPTIRVPTDWDKPTIIWSNSPDVVGIYLSPSYGLTLSGSVSANISASRIHVTNLSPISTNEVSTKWYVDSMTSSNSIMWSISGTTPKIIYPTNSSHVVVVGQISADNIHAYSDISVGMEQQSPYKLSVNGDSQIVGSLSSFDLTIKSGELRIDNDRPIRSKNSSGLYANMMKLDSSDNLILSSPNEIQATSIFKADDVRARTSTLLTVNQEYEFRSGGGFSTNNGISAGSLSSLGNVTGSKVFVTSIAPQLKQELASKHYVDAISSSLSVGMIGRSGSVAVWSDSTTLTSYAFLQATAGTNLLNVDLSGDMSVHSPVAGDQANVNLLSDGNSKSGLIQLDQSGNLILRQSQASMFFDFDTSLNVRTQSGSNTKFIINNSDSLFYTDLTRIGGLTARSGSVSSQDLFVFGSVSGQRMYIENLTPILKQELSSKHYVDSLSSVYSTVWSSSGIPRVIYPSVLSDGIAMSSLSTNSIFVAETVTASRFYTTNTTPIFKQELSSKNYVDSLSSTYGPYWASSGSQTVIYSVPFSSGVAVESLTSHSITATSSICADRFHTQNNTPIYLNELTSKQYVDSLSSAGIWVSLINDDTTISGDKGFVDTVAVGATASPQDWKAQLLVNTNANSFGGSITNTNHSLLAQRGWPSDITTLFSIRNSGIVDKPYNSCVRAVLANTSVLAASQNIFGQCSPINFEDSSSRSWDKQEKWSSGEFSSGQFTASLSGVYLVLCQATVRYETNWSPYDPNNQQSGTYLHGLGLIMYKNGTPWSSSVNLFNNLKQAFAISEINGIEYGSVALCDTVELGASDILTWEISNCCEGVPVLDLIQYMDFCSEGNADATFVNIYKII